MNCWPHCEPEPVIHRSAAGGRGEGDEAATGRIDRSRERSSEEHSPSSLHTGGRVEVHGRGPGLPILARGAAILGAEPLVEAEGPWGSKGRLSWGSHERCESAELFFRDALLADGHESGDVEAADKGPHTAVVVMLSLIHISEPTRLGMISYA